MYKEEKKFLKLISGLKRKEKIKLFLALKLIKKYHKKQLRKDGTPYFLHCLRTANFLIEKGGNKNWQTICGALLHDIVEDTPFKISQVKKIFGNKTAKIVSALTRKRKSDENEKEKYKNKKIHFLKLFKKEKEIKMVKVFDCLDNMLSWPKIIEVPEIKIKIKRWLKEAKNLYLPLAKSVDDHLFSLLENVYKKTKKKINL